MLDEAKNKINVKVYNYDQQTSSWILTPSPAVNTFAPPGRALIYIQMLRLHLILSHLGPSKVYSWQKINEVQQ